MSLFKNKLCFAWTLDTIRLIYNISAPFLLLWGLAAVLKILQIYWIFVDIVILTQRIQKSQEKNIQQTNLTTKKINNQEKSDYLYYFC